MPRSTETPAASNGPGKDKFLDMLADYEEHRFSVMQAMSLAGKVLAEWERWGGNKDDLRDGYKLRQMEPDEQKTELQRQLKVAGWLGIVDEDATGQKSFLKVFEQPANVAADALGIGGAPYGSRLSIGRAKVAGYNEGKAKNGPTMQEGLDRYFDLLGWSIESEEALSYCGGFGQGLELRPAPKPKKADQDDPEDGAEDDGQYTPDAAFPSAVVPATGLKKRGRPPGSKNKSAVDKMADKAQAMDAPKALPASDTLADAVDAELKAGWRSDRDTFDESMPEPPPPVH
jgi:hypothetical protein